MIHVQRITAEDWALYRSIRLASLKEAPYAFLSTYEDSVKRSDESWSAQASEASVGSDKGIFFAHSDNNIVGLCATYRCADNLNAAELAQVWVSPDSRSKGVALVMIKEVLEWLRSNKYYKCTLEVGHANSNAIRLYQILGFKECFRSKELIEMEKGLI